VSRLSDAFATARAQGRTALVCYAMGGDGDSAALLRAIDEAGADVIELGLPFSDPIADGPVLQAAATRALAGGATVRGVLAAAAQLRLRAPVVAMGYINPIESMGPRAFAQALRAAGLCGAIVPDLPLEEAQPLRSGSSSSSWCRWSRLPRRHSERPPLPPARAGSSTTSASPA